MMKFYRNKKLILIIFIAAIFLLLLGINFVNAQPKQDAASTQIANFGFFGYAILLISVKLMVLMAGLVDFTVRLGDSVLNLSAVQEGWKVVLNFTNLGFILGIIIIAFATIFRLESYALKQTLTKLIVAALLVNFSLVIAGGFMSISSVASSYFHDAALGEGGKNLSTALANAMNPQALGAVTNDSSLIEKSVEWLGSFTPAGNIKYITNIFFIIIFTFLTVLAFATLFIMLLMRAMTLIFLLILSPIVWLLWIFPATKKYFQQWWQEFIRWNFFAPAVYFFIYLSVMTASQIQKVSPDLKGWDYIVGVGDSTSAAGVFNSGTLINNLFTHAANLFVVLGLLYGGIYVANKFGIAGGDIGINLAKKAGKGAGAWAGRKTLGGIKNYTREGYNRIGEKMDWKNKSIEASQKGGFFNGVKARLYANLAAPAERERARYKDRVSNLTMPQAIAELSTGKFMTDGHKAALMEYISKNNARMPSMGSETKYEEKTIRDREGNLTFERTPQKVDKALDWKAKYLGGTKNKEIYERSGGDFDGDIVKKATGMSAEAADAYNNKDFSKFESEMDKFISKLKKSDMASVGKIWSKDIFKSPYGDNLKMAKIIAKVIGKTNSKIVASLLPHMDGKTVNNFSGIYKTELKDAKLTDELQKFEKAFSMFEISEGLSPASSEFGGGGGGGGGGGKEEKK